jgi:arylsulfatase A-like enzyme
MNRPPLASLLRAAGAGALAMAALGTVEIWFTDLLPSVFPRASFLLSDQQRGLPPLAGGFAVVLFLLYPLVGAVAAGVLAGIAHAFGWAPDSRSAGAAVALAVHAIFRVSHLAGGSLMLAAALNLILLALAVAGLASPRAGNFFPPLTAPWTVAFLLYAPVWVMTDLAANAARPLRAVAFVVAAFAIGVLAARMSKRSPRAGVVAVGSVTAMAATLAAVALVGPDPPRQRDAAATRPPARGPNVLLVTLDTVRADHLSLYGYGRDTTPSLARFAGSATVYSRAIAPSNMTLATHASLFTGLAASEHRAHYDVDRPAGRPLVRGTPTLAEIFVKRGYDVSSVAGNYGFLGTGFGLDRGFPWLDARPRRSTLGGISSDSVRGAFRRLLCGTLGVFPEADTRARAADEITDLAISRIDRARALSRPYFLFVNYFDAHERVLVPPPWAGLFSRPSRRPTGALFDGLLRQMNRTGRLVLSAQDREDLVARYDETLAYVDASLDRLLAHAAGRDGENDTLIVVTADHGEAWGEHEAIGHGSSAYEEQVWVPLVVKAPGQKTKKVVTAPVGLARVFALVTGAIDVIGGDAPVVSESFPLVPMAEKPGRGGRALFSGNEKLIRGSDGRIELYDLGSDPGEARDLAASPASAETLSRMTAMLDRWIAAHPPVTAPDTPERREDLERLRSLGYLR